MAAETDATTAASPPAAASPSPLVLVTGGSGFVASQLVQLLLDSGYTVRATVRSLANTTKTSHLLGLAAAHPGKLDLVEADLQTTGDFDECVKGCSVVFHVASPFLMPEQIKDAQSEVYAPAVRGTRNVLLAVDKAMSVTRVVMTSTVGAIFGDYADVKAMKDNTLSESYWNTSSTLATNPYHYAKTEAEKLAWQIPRPPPPSASVSGSLLLADELMSGQFFYGAPDFAFAFVDVRDVALAHLRAAEREDAKGRYIVARDQMVSFLDMSRILREKYPSKWWLPKHQVPHAGVRLLGPLFGLTQDYISKHMGIRFAVDNKRSINELGIEYRSVEDTVVAHYEGRKGVSQKR
ncbi:NAD(P)-binding protein [Gonapodya prolifera JEL478]|uniref:NAD(P)-binding protein n=1 Tax=Gonapodya prolifera (strain JEL478) TaxID=1344416 RepID=A0A139AQJ4_GONPJ|nr:NAD(P)-binding protein [Gonapodya prolifera JEL478]|eukprot:KXS19031.1 NAD(P)-binding protein [Gonapodya prolifera JEL478]